MSTIAVTVEGVTRTIEVSGVGADTHIADATDAHAGTAITNTPAGTVAAITVQAAINELATDYAAADTAHAGAGDPHTGYRLESADHTHATTGLQAGTIDHGALAGMGDDDHPQYVLAASANYVDLTDGGPSALHTHAGASGVKYKTVSFLVAAVGAHADVIASADYVCDGVADDVQIQAALDALPANGGIVVLSEGTFTLAATVRVQGSGDCLIGQGRSATILNTTSTTLIPIIIGSKNSTHIQHNDVGGFAVTGPTTGTMPLVYVWGCRFLRLHDMRTGGGKYGYVIRKIERCFFEHLRALNWSTGGVGFQAVAGTGNGGSDGNSDDLPWAQGLFLNCEAETGANGGLIGNQVVVADAAAQYNGDETLHSTEDEIDNAIFVNHTTRGTAAGTIGLSTPNGMRASGFIGGVFAHCRESDIDLTPLASGAFVRLFFDGTNFWHDTTSQVADSFKLDATQQFVHLRNCRTNRATDMFHVSGGSPTVQIDGMELTNIITNFINVDAGATPRFFLGPGFYGGAPSPSAKIAGAGSPVVVARDNVVAGTWAVKTRGKGTATITSAATSVTVTHGLDVTPAAQDIRVTPLENPTSDVGLLWVDGITSTQFVINCENAPGASNLDVAWVADVQP